MPVSRRTSRPAWQARKRRWRKDSAGGAANEPSFREAVAEEEANATAKAGSTPARDPSACWGTILASLRSSSANGTQNAAK